MSTPDATLRQFALTERQVHMGLSAGRLRRTELGLEKRCRQCGEWWPLDTEFFYPYTPSTGNYAEQAQPWCRACYRERYGRD